MKKAEGQRERLRFMVLGHGEAPASRPLPPVPLEREPLLFTFAPEKDDGPWTVDALKSDDGMRRLWEAAESVPPPLTALVQQALCHRRPGDVCVWQGYESISYTDGVHGRLTEAECTQCHKMWSWPPAHRIDVPCSVEYVDRLLQKRCGDCNAWLRPAVVLRGESIAPSVGFRLYSWIKKQRPSECVLVDADLRCAYARSMVRLCRRMGARIIHVTSRPDVYDWHAVREVAAVREEALFTHFEERMAQDEMWGEWKLRQ